MIRLTICILTSHIVLSGVSNGETKSMDFTNITVEETRAMVKKFDESELRGDIEGFIKAAIDSGRLEIMDVCFEKKSIASSFEQTVKAMPDSHLKDQLISRRLRNSRIFWVGAETGNTGLGAEEYVTANWLIPMLSKYLPDLPMAYSILETRQRRLKLADAFDTAAGIPIETEPEARRVWPPKPAEKPNMPPNLDGSLNKGGKVPATSMSGAPSPFGRRFAPYAVTATVLAIIAAWLAFRPKRGKQ